MVKKPTSLSKYQSLVKKELTPLRREFYPPTAAQVKMTYPEPNYMMGIGFENNQYQALHLQKLLEKKKGIFVHSH